MWLIQPCSTNDPGDWIGISHRILLRSVFRAEERHGFSVSRVVGVTKLAIASSRTDAEACSTSRATGPLSRKQSREKIVDGLQPGHQVMYDCSALARSLADALASRKSPSTLLIS